MKKLAIIISVFFALIVSAGAQQYRQTFGVDTIAADTSYYPSASSNRSVASPLTGLTVTSSTGVISYTFTHADISTGDSIAAVQIQGSNNGTVWTSVGSNGAVADLATGGTTNLYTSTPLLYLYYRVAVYGKVGNTVKISSSKLIYKKD
jgi:hypothetical protein